jgi:hypothetical protein
MIIIKETPFGYFAYNLDVLITGIPQMGVDDVSC